jgi:cobalt-zinc-cadmium efflux system protein
MGDEHQHGPDGHDHSHSHGHGHGHGTLPDSERRVFWAMVLTGGFMGVEVVGGLVSGSLALLADAGHMLTDFAALGLAWFAFRVARRPPDRRRSYGYHRVQVLAAFVNGIMLVAVVGWILVEAIGRLFAPVEILGGVMLAVAVGGLLVNIASFALLHGGDRDNINMKAAAIHVLGDLLGSAAAILAAGVILATGWAPIDPLLSILVALLILRSSWSIIRKSGHILLEGTPEWLDVESLRDDLVAAVPGVEDVHHVHVWSLTTEHPLITLHAVLGPGGDHEASLAAIKAHIKDKVDIDHATVQIELGPCPDPSATPS